MRNICTILITLLFLFVDKIKAQEAFVSVNHHQFILNNKPYYYIGANYWYAGLLGLQTDKSNSIERLKTELDFLRQKGITNLRVLVGAEGTGQIHGVKRVEPALQPQQGKFNEEILKGLDVLLAEMNKRNMKAVLFLSNNWEWSGGFLQYLNWNGLIADSVLRRRLNWNEYRDYVSKFYTCTACQEDYNKQLLFVLNHTNSISGKKYKDDPSIMAWEIANEPRPMRPSANQAYKEWLNKTAALIKSNDKNHLVTIGNEGEMGTESLQLFEEIHADKNVDYLTIHIWPKNWSWFRDTAIKKDWQRIISNTENYINKHAVVAQKLNKPLVIEEFGLPRNNQSFELNTSTSLRDAYYNKIFSYWLQNANSNGVIAGANFWAFGGIIKPIKDQVFWKEGDAYMGDPPMEEQGLNSVFTSDVSTWQVIENYSKKSGAAQKEIPSDKKATKETVALYNNLKKLLNKGIMFGHQDDLAYGVGWKYEAGRSDIKDVTGDYPAVYGFELGRLEIDHAVNLDSVPFDKMKGFIRSAYDRGGVVTLSWHLNNPLTGKTAWNPAPGTVASILPGGEKNELYKSWLDKVASFILDLKGNHGEYIPIIFRPFHELNGSWFWWGGKNCTPDELKQLYHFTEAYLRDEKNVHNLLYAFNTDKFYSREEYMERYPGDDWVDVIGFDIYQAYNTSKNEDFIKYAGSMLATLDSVATEHNKIPALTEFGNSGLKDSVWWTSTFLKAIAPYKISYALAWRNAGIKDANRFEFYVPYKGHSSANNFVEFYKNEKTLFQKDVTKEKVYQ
jgi:mannan endo-1,4-beta-mannosidase